jgi:hypothetical protein
MDCKLLGRGRNKHYVLQVDPTLTENITPSQQLDEDEWSMQVFKVSLDNLFSVLQGKPNLQSL